MQCTNYRGISFLSIPGKVYARILDYKVRDITEAKVLEEQGHLGRDPSRFSPGEKRGEQGNKAESV